jgi:Fe-S cluster assembly iron-binding protein IscA
MLHITPEAGLAIRKLVEAQGAATGGGLRVEAREGEPAFDMSVAALPDETDLVVTEETTGAKVMLDSLTADYVEDKTLDVADTVESTIRFELTGQGVTNAD